MRKIDPFIASRKGWCPPAEFTQLGTVIHSSTHLRLRVAAATSRQTIGKIVTQAIERELDQLKRELEAAGEGAR